MKVLRENWMTRAAIVLVVIGTTLIAWTVFVIDVYRDVRPDAPSWLLADAGRGGTWLDKIFLGIWGCVGSAWAIAAWIALSRLFRIPDTWFSEPSDAESYPFVGRKLSRRAKTQAGQEGFVPEMLDRFGEVTRGPLTPPKRPRPDNTD